MDYEPLVPPIPAPDLKIPKSEATVEICAIDSGARFSLPIDPFLTPNIADKTRLSGPAFSFLITHPSGRRSVFDLGILSTLTQYPPGIQTSIANNGWEVTPGRDIARILTEDRGIDLDSVHEVIWSHAHWDHVGAPWQFPARTALVVGPGFREAFLPGYPADESSRVLARSWEGRELREVDFRSGAQLRVGRFEAVDWYGDGSFYLLHAPGHAVGHMCGLARTTPGTFVFLGGDVCHHGGEMRPTEYVPLPREVTPGMVPRLRSVCPGSEYVDGHPEKSGVKPFYRMTESFPSDIGVAEWSLEGTEEFDACRDIFVCLAHDESLLEVLEYLPKTMNGWRGRGWGEKVRWRFLGDFEIGEKDR
ncbi:hypothetical protein EJ05DRAFT_247426 [Pseudovirgaria hyperparasitica]|uniref:Metallo-beta-lactamase domain-containing protein n=1 Tax=Pseudovirgaria hyperparasitica TaxID=470096 RepID=A0A6A6WIG1_9PEZI|nr:uncharacterized protein EJ05DRAFT_247426 [Pseudovirgaria hyperparasitica]KAF2760941.1 hypothetical protein EJ05DRAFT_247426 [Pseudovirgaria hyperparasitica]